ncbi:hypothetical protein [uncultured Paludibaculum sp.]|uniref:outer membrane protein n=1 Tax=uncultured Paludibaculum sp. TaxID=1765020 RepID=UPI002AAB92A8|nr:hypothetical protein [uncultured Paludibaculum sp.]
MRLVFLLGAIVLACGPTWAQSGGGGVGGFGGQPIGQSQDPSNPSVQSMNVGFMPWLSLNGTYTHPMGASTVSRRDDLFGGSASGGFGGSKAWENSELQAGYVGSGTYNNLSYGRGFSRWRQTHVVNLGYARQLNQRWQAGFNETGGLSDGGYGIGSAYGASGVPGLGSGFGLGSGSGGDLTGGGGFLDSGQNGIVDNEILGARVKFSVTRASLAYRVSERLSFNGTGGAAFARRGSSLSGLNSYTGGGGVNYQLSQRTQVGANYARTNVDYVGLFGGVHYDTAQGGFQTRLTENLSLTVRGGGALLSSTYVGTTQLPPDLAALLGVTATQEVKKASTKAFIGNVLLGYTTPKGSFSAGYNRGVAPGNGVVYTSVRDSAVASYGYRLGQNVGINFFAAYTRMSGRVAVFKVTQTAQGGGMLSYKLFKSVSLTGQGGYRYTTIPGVLQQRDVFAGIGLAWRPGDAVFVF